MLFFFLFGPRAGSGSMGSGCGVTGIGLPRPGRGAGLTRSHNREIFFAFIMSLFKSEGLTFRPSEKKAFRMRSSLRERTRRNGF